jgi:quercetin dioxygenase-like cupin family protein
MKPNRLFAAAALPALCLLAGAAFAQDMVQVMGKQAKVVLENERVRVIEIEVAPGASTGMHSHAGDQVVVFLSGGQATQTNADGSTRTMDRKAGDVAFSGPVTHDTMNSGKKKVHTLVIELKGAPATPSAP